MLETAVTYSFENILWISAIFVTGYLSWKAAVYFTKLEDTRKKVASLPCEKRKEEIDLHSKNHVETSKSIERIETTLGFIQKTMDQLAQKGNKLIIGPYTKSHSSLSITDAGREMMERLGVGEMFEKNWLRIDEFIEDKLEYKNPYDIQEFLIQQAVVYPEKFLQPEEIDKIKLDAYNTGVNIVPYMKVIAILARDRYFSEHNILVEDVDKHDPLNKNKKPE
mgnify:FL=1|jgi:hypothetical protein